MNRDAKTLHTIYRYVDDDDTKTGDRVFKRYSAGVRAEREQAWC